MYYYIFGNAESLLLVDNLEISWYKTEFLLNLKKFPKPYRIVTVLIYCIMNFHTLHTYMSVTAHISWLRIANYPSYFVSHIFLLSNYVFKADALDRRAIFCCLTLKENIIMYNIIHLSNPLGHLTHSQIQGDLLSPMRHRCGRSIQNFYVHERCLPLPHNASFRFQ